MAPERENLVTESKGSYSPCYPIPSMVHYVYIIEMNDGHLYVGTTGNLDQRIREHTRGQGSGTIRIEGYKRLLYKEPFTTRLSAERRETQLKGWSHAKKIALAAGKPILLKKLSKRKS